MIQYKCDHPMHPIGQDDAYWQVYALDRAGISTRTLKHWCNTHAINEIANLMAEDDVHRISVDRLWR